MEAEKTTPPKTGALICKKPDAEKGMTYEALIFIKNIPHHFTDEDLKKKLNLKLMDVDISGCSEILFRADIHSASNEVQEQFEQLNAFGKPVPEMSWEAVNAVG